MKGNKYIIIGVCLFLAVGVMAFCGSGSDQYEPQNDYAGTDKIFKASISDNETTFTKDEYGTGA